MITTSKALQSAVTLGLMMLSAAPVTQAAVLFSSFGAGTTYDITQGNPVGNAFDGSNYAEGDTFSSGTNAVLTSIVLALGCAANCPVTDNFFVSLTRDAGDQPGVALESFTVAGNLLGSLGLYTAPLILNSIIHPSLSAGTPYWVTVSANASDSIEWNLNTVGDTADHAISLDGGSSWFSPSGITPGAFAVNGTVIPEPASFVCLVGGVLLLSGMRKRLRS